MKTARPMAKPSALDGHTAAPETLIDAVREQLSEPKERLRAVVSDYGISEPVVFEGEEKTYESQLAIQCTEKD